MAIPNQLVESARGVVERLRAGFRVSNAQFEELADFIAEYDAGVALREAETASKTSNKEE